MPDPTRRVAIEVKRKIEAILHKPDAFAQVPAIWREVRGSRWEKANAFQLLDERPSLFGNGAWHTVLRQCRNHPGHGPEMFGVRK